MRLVPCHWHILLQTAVVTIDTGRVGEDDKDVKQAEIPAM